MRAAKTVNLPLEPDAVEKAISNAYVAEDVDAATLTLAPESRHIVASGLSGTTSRAAVLILDRSKCSA
jgi:hypothetical protein